MFDNDLIRRINSGRCFVLIGSGPSTEIGYPSWPMLAKEIWKKVKSLNPDADEISFNSFLTDKSYPEALRQAEVDSKKNRENFVNLAHETFDSLRENRAVNKPIYDFLVQWPFACYLTTNYDDEIQKFLTRENEYFSVLGNQNQDLANIRDSVTNLIVKIHSDFSHPDKIILTSEDYDKIQHDSAWEYYRAHLRRIFETFDMLIIGHGMKDPDLQHLLAVAKQISLPSHPIYMVIANVTDGEKRELYEKYNIRVISYNTVDERHEELKKILLVANKFIATRGNTHPQIANVSEEETINAISLFLYRTLSSFSKAEQKSVIQIISPLIFRILNKESDLSIEEVHEKLKFFFSSIDINFTRDCCEYLISHGFLLKGRELLSLSSKGKCEISQIEGTRKLEEEQAFGQIKLKIKKQNPDILPSDLDVVISTLKNCTIAIFQNRGISAAAAIVGKEHESGMIKSDIFQELHNASMTLRPELRGIFLGVGGDFFLSPNEPQQKYLASLSQGFFLYHMAGMDPSCSKIRKDIFRETSWLLDASVILQYLAVGCAGYDYAQSLFNVLIDSGSTLYITDKLLREVQRHFIWAKKLVHEYGVDAPEFRDAALAKGYKQNLFIDGYIRCSARGEVGSFDDYLQQLKVVDDMVKIDNIESINILNICDDEKTLADMKSYQDEISRIRKLRNTFRHDQQCEAEAEVIAIIKHLSLVEPSKHIYFVSQSHILDDLGNGQAITWSPETLYRYVCSLPTVNNDPSLFQQCLLDTYYNSGITIIDQKQYRRFFGVAIDQAKIQFDREKQNFIKQLEDSRISVAELEEEFVKTPDLEKPMFVQQMGWFVARNSERKVKEQQELVKKTENERAFISSQLREAEHARDLERKQRITAEQQLAQIRNKKDLKHQRKRERQAKRRAKKK